MSCYIGPPTWYLKTAGGQMTGNISFAGAQTVDGVDISAIDQAKIKVGTYVGNGADNRDINIGINLAAKNNVYIIIKHAGGSFAVHRAEYSQGDLTMRYDGLADTADYIQGLTSTGFQIGANAVVNTNGQTYRYIVIYEEP